MTSIPPPQRGPGGTWHWTHPGQWQWYPDPPAPRRRTGWHGWAIGGAFVVALFTVALLVTPSRPDPGVKALEDCLARVHAYNELGPLPASIRTSTYEQMTGRCMESEPVVDQIGKDLATIGKDQDR